jgi:hypothetical protein
MYTQAKSGKKLQLFAKLSIQLLKTNFQESLDAILRISLRRMRRGI